MWKILKYLLPLLVVAAICGGTGERVADIQEDFMSEASLDAVGCQNSISRDGLGYARETVAETNNDKFEELESNRKNYHASVYYMDIVSELEKMGDFIINISQTLEKSFVKK